MSTHASFAMSPVAIDATSLPTPFRAPRVTHQPSTRSLSAVDAAPSPPWSSPARRQRSSWEKRDIYHGLVAEVHVVHRRKTSRSSRLVSSLTTYVIGLCGCADPCCFGRHMTVIYRVNKNARIALGSVANVTMYRSVVLYISVETYMKQERPTDAGLSAR